MPPETPREIIAAQPRGFCAGVRRAINIIEKALENAGQSVYCFREIVHNQDVVADLQDKGVLFVNDLSRIPEGSTVVFSAHGVSPEVREQARHQQLNIVDATCPFVNKVHQEVKRFASQGSSIILVGIRGHDEVTGVVAEAPDKITVIENRAEAEQVKLKNPEDVAVIMQTTLSIEDAADILQTLQERFPRLKTPAKSDICYATQKRQNAVRELAQRTEKILVLGAKNSSNTNRLVEVASAAGTEGILISTLDDLAAVDLSKAEVIGVTAGASTPEAFVQDVLTSLQQRTDAAVKEVKLEQEERPYHEPETLSA